MAKKSKDEEPKEELSKEEQAEQKQLEKEKKKQQEERLKKKKLREKKAKEKQRKELKRIKSLVNLPFQLLVNISVVAALLSFLITYFLLNKDPISTIMTSFLIFSVIYLGIGIITVSIFWFLSIEKEKAFAEAEKEEERKRQEEERLKKEEELKELEQIEKEIAANRFKTERAKPYLESEPPLPIPNSTPEIPREDELGANIINNNETFDPLSSFSTSSQDDDEYLKEMMK
jgi:hypothetical protein